MDKIVEGLRELPEVRLEIIRLSWELITEEGEIDQQKASLRAEEVDMAVREARAYAASTRKAVECLQRMAPSSSSDVD